MAGGLTADDNTGLHEYSVSVTDGINWRVCNYEILVLADNQAHGGGFLGCCVFFSRNTYFAITDTANWFTSAI